MMFRPTIERPNKNGFSRSRTQTPFFGPAAGAVLTSAILTDVTFNDILQNDVDCIDAGDHKTTKHPHRRFSRDPYITTNQTLKSPSPSPNTRVRPTLLAHAEESSLSGFSRGEAQLVASKAGSRRRILERFPAGTLEAMVRFYT